MLQLKDSRVETGNSLPLPVRSTQACNKVGEANLGWRGPSAFLSLPIRARTPSRSILPDSQRVGPAARAAGAQSGWCVKSAHPAGPCCSALPSNCGKCPHTRLPVGLATRPSLSGCWGDTLLSVREVGLSSVSQTSPSSWTHNGSFRQAAVGGQPACRGCLPPGVATSALASYPALCEQKCPTAPLGPRNSLPSHRVLL